VSAGVLLGSGLTLLGPPGLDADAGALHFLGLAKEKTEAGEHQPESNAPNERAHDNHPQE
jgi:hypothetical protein